MCFINYYLQHCYKFTLSHRSSIAFMYPQAPKKGAKPLCTYYNDPVARQLFPVCPSAPTKPVHGKTEPNADNDPVARQLFPVCPSAPTKPVRGKMEPNADLDSVAFQLFPTAPNAPRKHAVAIQRRVNRRLEF